MHVQYDVIHVFVLSERWYTLELSTGRFGATSATSTVLAADVGAPNATHTTATFAEVKSG